MEVTVNDMLCARDERVKRQKELLSEYGETLICFTMNIAGPIKQTPVIERGFTIGIDQIKAQLEGENIPIAYFEEERKFTGCTAYFSVCEKAEQVKKLTSEIEDSSAIGRLFDIDVIKKSGEKVSRTELGLTPRKCLICDKDARICGSSRAHTVKELQDKTDKILKCAVKENYSEKIAALAVKSLLYEVCTTPKAGLVDMNNSGSHKDMNVFTFLDSSSVLYPFFKECALCGIENAENTAAETFKKLRIKGKIAQKNMLDATGGINTHKGAIFSMGVIAAACGRFCFNKNIDEKRLLCECADMVNGVTEELSRGNDTNGKEIFRKYGITGIRGQVQSGFPSVINCGYPILKKGVKRGLSLNEAGAAALLHILLNTEDTNMLKRIGKEKTAELKAAIKSATDAEFFPSASVLEELDRLFIKNNASPGGSADLLAISYFLYFYFN